MEKVRAASFGHARTPVYVSPDGGACIVRNNIRLSRHPEGTNRVGTCSWWFTMCHLPLQIYNLARDIYICNPNVVAIQEVSNANAVHMLLGFVNFYSGLDCSMDSAGMQQSMALCVECLKCWHACTPPL